MIAWSGVFLRVLLIVSFWMPLPLLANDRPDWTTRSPKEDISNKRYVGRAIDLPTDAQAIEAATKDAMAQAIRDNFGVTAQIQAQTYESISQSSVVSRSTERSRAVQLRDFNLEDSFVEKSDHGYSAWVQYKFSKAAIQIEKTRLSSAVKDEPIDFTVVGNPDARTTSQLDISTDPPGANIFIDGEKVLGKTPLRLRGLVDPGKHTVQIEHPQYVTVTRDVIIVPNGKVEINEILVPATGSLSIDTKPDGATILIDGQFAGVSPISNLAIPAALPVHLDFLHLDAERSSEEIRVGKGEHKSVLKELPLKPAYVQVIVDPVGSTVLVDGRKIGAGWNTIDPGKHTLSFTKDGYEPNSASVDLRGGERKSINTKLKSWSEEQRRFMYSPWVAGASIEYSGASFHGDPTSGFARIGVHGGRRFAGIFGVDLSLGADGGSSSNGSSSATNNYTMSGYSAQIAVPVFPISHVYLKPAFGYSAHSYSQTADSTSPSFTINQIYEGAFVGYEFNIGQWLIPVELGAVNYGNGSGLRGTASGAIVIGALYAF